VSVVDDVDAGLHAILGTGHIDQRADGLGRLAPAPDHSAHVVGSYVHVEAQSARRSSVSIDTASGSLDSERAR